MTSDECATHLKKWVTSIETEANLNEATTRLRYIDRLFQDCLNWDSKNITTEERDNNGKYIDYVFSNPRRLLIVEAKKEGIYFDIPASTTDRAIYSLPHLLTSSPSLKKAIDQAFGYCTRKGVQIAAVCNGRQLVVFIASRTDGREPLAGNALVFQSPETMERNFLQLWQALSPDGIQADGLRKILSDVKVEEVPEKLSNFITEYPGTKRKTELQEDFETLSELLFEEILTEPEREEDFLRACYCQSEYLSNFTLQSKQILKSRYSRLASLGINLRELGALDSSLLNPKNVKKLITQKPILLVGDVNVGKTSFIRNLIKVEAPELFSRFVNIYIDFRTQANLEEDLALFVKREITIQLRDTYKIDLEERNFVRGVYRGDLKDFARTIYADLKKANPDLYIQREVEFLEQKVADNVAHLKKALAHLVRDRKVVIFLDNADQRNEYDQEKAFLIGQELAGNYDIIVFISLRPETFEKLKTKGALAGYYSRVFTIRPPALEDVVRKRMEFVLQLATGTRPIHALKIGKIKLENITKLIKVFNFALQNDRRIPECIENISSGNVSAALAMMRDFFSNAHVPHEKILSDAERGNYIMPVFYLIESIIYKQHKYFDPRDSYVVNIFDISSNNLNQHFAALITLAMLKSSNGEDGFEEVVSIYNRLQDFSFSPAQIDYSLGRLVSGGLVELSVPAGGEYLGMKTKIRITEKGIYHLDVLAKNFSYLDAMTVDTPILDNNIRAAINEVDNINGRLSRVKKFYEYLDNAWASISPSTNLLSWSDYSTETNAEIERINRSITKKYSE